MITIPKVLCASIVRIELSDIRDLIFRRSDMSDVNPKTEYLLKTGRHLGFL